MIIKTLQVGPLQANCHIVGCERTRQAVVIDPGGDTDRITRVLVQEKLTVSAIVNTHGHFDHVSGNYALKKATESALMIHALDAPLLNDIAQSAAQWGLRAENSPVPDRLLKDGDSIEIGDIVFTVLHTPGHTPGGICLHADGAVFVGDSLFAGSIGRTDFPGGDYDTLIHSIHTKLFTLADDVVAYTGHMEPTTIGREKKYNPFCGVG